MGCSLFARRYWGNRVCFLFLGVLRWFTSPRYLLTPYRFRSGFPDVTPGWLPYSEIPGSKLACNSPGLIAACCVLHRLPAPRHPPYALSSLTISQNSAKSFAFTPDARDVKDRTLRQHPLRMPIRLLLGPEGHSDVRNSMEQPLLVENTGIEPVTSWLQTRRSPS